MQDNRQLRVWFLVLYPYYNYNHLYVLYMLLKGFYSNTLDYACIFHKAKYEDGELVKRSHVHIVIWDKVAGIRRSTLCKYLQLDKEDLHLIKGLDEFKKSNNQRMFKTVDNYLDYLTHLYNKNKPDKYSVEDFRTNVPETVYQAINKASYTPAESFNYLVRFIDNVARKDINTRFWDTNDWYMYCCDNGTGEIFFRHWNKIIEILKSYRTFT